MLKITAKTTKEQLKKVLGANVASVKEQDKDLYDRIAYADKMAKKDDSKVSRKDLVDLVKETMKLLGDSLVEPALAQETPVETPVKPQAENSVKLTKGGKKKAEPEVAEESNETPAETTEKVGGVTKAKTEEKVDSKSAKKSLGKKKEQPKKDGVTVLEGSDKNDKTVQMAKMFPQTLEVGDSKYELASDINTMEDLYNALNNDEEIIFAYYWTKRHLRQFPYFNGWLGQPKSFNNDLDLATAIYASDDKKVAYSVSSYTEAVYCILPSDLEVEDGVRVSGGIEFQIYRPK